MKTQFPPFTPGAPVCCPVCSHSFPSRAVRPSDRKQTVTITADDLPLSAPASSTLDRLSRALGGVRGYGGKEFAGHWLKIPFVKPSRVSRALAAEMRVETVTFSKEDRDAFRASRNLSAEGDAVRLALGIV